ncbi:hypothetical protein B296_00046118 [Ensete ventricosum]|uniref:Uncharacterized protein n=1 Tax=Ensete ventricosum TaxID=4639 RepID=A0A426X6S4_ENSVE|nr:hypothetical protein B296_00046118 [Ensete ventricosum]
MFLRKGGSRPWLGHLYGWLATAWPPARGLSAVAKAPCKGATCYGQGPMHRRWSPAANLQGRQPSTGMISCSAMPVRATSPQGRQPPTSTAAYSAAPARAANPQGVAASRVSDAGRKGGRRLTGRLPADKGSRRLCKGGDDTVGVREEG